MNNLKMCYVKLVPLSDVTFCNGEDFTMSKFLSKTMKRSEDDKKLSISNTRKIRQPKRGLDENEVENEKRNSSAYKKMIQKNREEKMALLKYLKIDEVKEEFKEMSTRLVKKSAPVKKIYIKKQYGKTPVRKSRRLLKQDVDLSVEIIYAKAIKEANKKLYQERKVLREKYFRKTVNAKEDFEFTSEADKKFYSNYVSYFKQMKLRVSNIADVVPNRISALAVHPSTKNVIVMAGSKYGHLGFWNVTSDSNPVIFSPHVGLISNLRVNPVNHFQIITSSYDGTLCSGDVEKKVFDEKYNVSEETECTYFDFLSETTLLVSQKNGNVSVIDVRNRSLKNEKKHECHDCSVNTVSVHPVNKSIFLTADNKGLLKVWDLRKLQKNPIISISHHWKSVSSAFFSPVTGNSILSTSLDQSICLFDSTNIEKEIFFKKTFMHYNTRKFKMVTRFQATWLPNSEEAFVVGSKSKDRQIKIYNSAGTGVFSFTDKNFSVISHFNQFHPSLNVLAGASSCGRVFVFMDTDLKF